MVSMAQMETCRALAAERLRPVDMPDGIDSPIPGVILFADDGHRSLEMVMGDGRTVDLLKVWRLAEDCIRNWHKGTPEHIPSFVGDFGRLARLAEALNGRDPRVLPGVIKPRGET
jgi:hypothetical protein